MKTTQMVSITSSGIWWVNPTRRKEEAMEKDICPNCGKKELEKIQLPLDLAWLEIPGYEDWGFAHCGQCFFKKIEIGT